VVAGGNPVQIQVVFELNVDALWDSRILSVEVEWIVSMWTHFFRLLFCIIHSACPTFQSVSEWVLPFIPWSCFDILLSHFALLTSAPSGLTFPVSVFG
jgi:hypothetical protein